MLIGNSIRATVGAASIYYSPWFRRGGTRAIFACHMIANANAASFAIKAQTKKDFDQFQTTLILDVGAGAATIGLTADTVTTFKLGNALNGDATVGFNDMVRLVYTLTSTASNTAWAHFRMLNTSWES